MSDTFEVKPASKNFDVKQRDWCLVPQVQKPQGDAPAALLFLTSMDKNASYDDLLEHCLNESSRVQVIYAPAGTVLGDYMHGLLDACNYGATDFDAMLDKVVAKVAELALLPKEPGVGYGFCTHYYSMRHLKLDFISNRGKLEEYIESLANAAAMIEDVEKRTKPPLASALVHSLEDVVRNIKGCNSLVGTKSWDPTLREVLSHCEELTDEGLLPEDLYLRMADWLKQQRDMKNRGRLMAVNEGPRPGIYARDHNRRWRHEDDFEQNMSYMPSTEDQDAWSINTIHFPMNLLDR